MFLKTTRKITRLLFSHILLIILLILFQLVAFYLLISYLSDTFEFVYILLMLISVGFVVYLFSEDKSPDYKLIWALVIMLFPAFGGLFYLLWGKKSIDWKVVKNLHQIYEETNGFFPENGEILNELSQEDLDLELQAKYIQNVSHAPVYNNTQAEYFPLGESWFESVKIELEKAEKFILLEYFIIEPGIMYDSILEILKRKANEGVKVYMLYDDWGCVAKFKNNYYKELQAHGINCYKFNPLRPQVYTFMNYRDHRKTMVIDGKVGYMSGLNLADEYINEVVRFGHWKDTACLIRGEAVWSITILFFQLWCFSSKQKVDINWFKAENPDIIEPGFVQPYGDDPLDNFNVAENAYLDVISRSKKYVYIATPYLILDSEMISTLKIAGMSGIDIKIIVPGIPDKWYVDFVTKSNYKVLLEAGVRIFEYTPGFIHAKQFVSDDRMAILGTANLDYRSLFLHFECCTAFYKHKIVDEIKEDMLLTLEDCTEIMLSEVLKTPLITKIIQSLLRIIAPLM